MCDDNLELVEVIDVIDHEDGSYTELQLLSDGKTRAVHIPLSWEPPF